MFVSLSPAQCSRTKYAGGPECGHSERDRQGVGDLQHAALSRRRVRHCRSRRRIRSSGRRSILPGIQRRLRIGDGRRRRPIAGCCNCGFVGALTGREGASKHKRRGLRRHARDAERPCDEPLLGAATSVGPLPLALFAGLSMGRGERCGNRGAGPGRRIGKR
jgi:5-methylcytosine-specific restriction endonuclease McrA